MTNHLATPGAETVLVPKESAASACQAMLSQYWYAEQACARYLEATRGLEDRAADATAFLDDAKRRLVHCAAALEAAEVKLALIHRDQKALRREIDAAVRHMKEIEKREKTRRVLFCIPFVSLFALLESSLSSDQTTMTRLQKEVDDLAQTERAVQMERHETDVAMKKAARQEGQARLEKVLLPIIEKALINKREEASGLCMALRREANALLREIKKRGGGTEKELLEDERPRPVKYEMDLWSWRALFAVEPDTMFRGGASGRELTYSLLFRNHQDQIRRGRIVVESKTKNSKLIVTTGDDFLRAREVKALDYRHFSQKMSLKVDIRQKPVFEHIQGTENSAFDLGCPLEVKHRHRSEIVRYYIEPNRSHRVARIFGVGESSWFFLETPSTGQKGQTVSFVDLMFFGRFSQITLVGERILRNDMEDDAKDAGFWFLNHNSRPCFGVMLGDLFFHTLLPGDVERIKKGSPGTESNLLCDYLSGRLSLPPESNVSVSNKLRFLDKNGQQCTASVIPKSVPWNLAHEDGNGVVAHSPSLRLLDWEGKPLTAHIRQGRLYRVDEQAGTALLVDALPYIHGDGSKWTVRFHDGFFFHVDKDETSQSRGFAREILYRGWDQKERRARVGYPFVRPEQCFDEAFA